MRGAAAFLLLWAVPACAGPVGAGDVHAAAPTGFPGAYLTTVRLSLAEDPLYASRLLDAVQLTVKAVCAMTSEPAIAGYLEQSATGGDSISGLRRRLGAEALPTTHASALLVANALARPDQFREVMDGLETLKPGLGRHAADILRSAQGQGSPRAIAALQAAGARVPQGEGLTYGADGRWAVMFDGSRAAAAASSEDAVSVPAYGAGSRRRGLALAKPERP